MVRKVLKRMKYEQLIINIKTCIKICIKYIKTYERDKVSAQVVPDYRRKLKEEKYPLKVKITFKGEQRYYGTKYALTKEEWELLKTMMPVSKRLKEVKHEIISIEIKANY